MGLFFSPATGGFYETGVHTHLFLCEEHVTTDPESGQTLDRWCEYAPNPQGPIADAVEITAYEHAALLEGLSNRKRIVVNEDGRPVLADPPPPTEEDIRANWKRERSQQVDAIQVTVDDLVFDGDETSQTRMARAVIGLQDGETIRWVLADNTPAEVTRSQLLEALRMAGEKQAALWV